MSELAKSSREAMRAKAKRLTSGEPHTKVDSSTWSPPEMENAGIKTGARPLSKRQYKSGGKVHGADAKKRADRAKRKSGGRTESVDRSKRFLTPDNLINRDVRMANDDREGIKHVGAFKKGGKVKRTKHADGSAVPLPPRRPVPLPPRRPTDMDGIRLDPAMQAIQDAKALAMQDAARKTNAANFDAQQQEYQRNLPQNQKRGGKVKDRKHHARGGHAHPDEAEDKALIKKMIKTSAMKRDEHCWGGETKQKKADGGKIDWLRKKHAKGGEVFSGNSVTKIPGEVPGGRHAHKSGGKAKGKTHININVNAHPAGGMPMAGGPMGGPPTPPMPPIPPMAPPAGGPPMGGGQQINPAMLAMLAKGGAGGPPPMPPQGGMPMARKSGGRTMGKPEHIIDHAAGGGLGRLEKIKAYGHKA